MGEEVHGLHLDGFDEILPDPESQTATSIDDKIYVVTELDKNGCSSITVRIFEKTTRRWITPTVLGPNPGPFRGHYSVLLNKDRVLVINQDSLLDDCIWFLEVDTPFVREQRKVHGADVVAWSKGVIGDSFVPVVISGPSGVGKGTLISKLMMEFPSMFGFSVSHTTRLPREKEVDGVHYHFTERSKMEKDVLAGKFLETAAVHGNLYGTSIEAVETVTDAGKRCILDIDVQGARSVRASALEAIFVFISPPSFDELEKRLRARGTETEEQVQKRLRNAKSELEEGGSPGLFDHILVNDNLETCYENLKKILALHGRSDVSSQPCAKRETPLNDKNEQKFLMQCQSSEGSKKLFLLDVSCIKGGAPGRTRGLKIDVSGKLADVPRISNDNSMFSVAQHATKTTV